MGFWAHFDAAQQWEQRAEIPIILAMQHFLDSAGVMDAIVLFTESIHPSCVITALVPFLCFMGHTRQAVTFAIALGVSDIMNMVYKLIARGDRPYWFDEKILQYHSTCEPGWGQPSGHMNAISGVVLTGIYLYNLNASHPYVQKVFVPLLLLAGCVSRVSTGSHFILQTILGMCTGYAMANFGTCNWVQDFFTISLEKSRMARTGTFVFVCENNNFES